MREFREVLFEAAGVTVHRQQDFSDAEATIRGEWFVPVEADDVRAALLALALKDPSDLVRRIRELEPSASYYGIVRKAMVRTECGNLIAIVAR